MAHVVSPSLSTVACSGGGSTGALQGLVVPPGLVCGSKDGAAAAVRTNLKLQSLQGSLRGLCWMVCNCESLAIW
jgi:hypothetical protein